MRDVAALGAQPQKYHGHLRWSPASRDCMLLMCHPHTKLSIAAEVGPQPRSYTGWPQWPRSESGIQAWKLQCSHTPITACSCY